MMIMTPEKFVVHWKLFSSPRTWRCWQPIITGSQFIPFAHGMRLFGQFYTDTMRPEDPYAFVQLLETSDLQSIERNRDLAALAATVRQNPKLKQKLKTKKLSGMDSGFTEKAKQFFHRNMETEFTVSGRTDVLPEVLVSIILEMSEADPPKKTSGKSRSELEAEFLAGFDVDTRAHAEDLLDLARMGAFGQGSAMP